jgi:hypothetical protein
METTAMQTHSHAQFPGITGLNLQRQKLELPQDFQGELNLVLVAFQQWQQTQVDTWIPFARQLEETHSGVRYYELPIIRRLNVLARTFINEGMRAGIPDPVARERTITLYVDKETFRESLQLSHEDDIHVLLLDRHGQVLWRAEGTFTKDKGDSLAAKVRRWAHNEAD